MSLKLFSKEKKGIKDLFPQTEYVIEPSFIYGGEQHFCFKDIFTVPCFRSLMALQAYEEVSMRMNRDFLIEDMKATKTLHERMKGYMNTGNLIEAYESLKEADRLLEQKKERLEWIFEPNVLYNLASIVYFDASENPLKYDQEYAKKKIEKWKNNPDVLGFFLQEPIHRFMPYSKLSREDLEKYLAVVNSLVDQQWENIFTILSRPIQKLDSK